MTEGCTTCNGTEMDRIKLIQTISEQISGAHIALAALYEAVAADSKHEDDRAAFLMAASEQKDLAQRSQFVTIPDLLDKTSTKE